MCESINDCICSSNELFKLWSSFWVTSKLTEISNILFSYVIKTIWTDFPISPLNSIIIDEQIVHLCITVYPIGLYVKCYYLTRKLVKFWLRNNLLCNTSVTKMWKSHHLIPIFIGTPDLPCIAYSVLLSWCALYNFFWFQ